jgi:hypothetical protein
VERDTQELLAASVKGKALNIKQLSQSVNDGKARIEKLFSELETATAEHDAKAKVFDEQLAAPAETS